MTDPGWNRVPIEPQSVNAPLSSFAVFLVVTIKPEAAAADAARAVATQAHETAARAMEGVRERMGDPCSRVPCKGLARRSPSFGLGCRLTLRA